MKRVVLSLLLCVLLTELCLDVVTSELIMVRGRGTGQRGGKKMNALKKCKYDRPELTGCVTTDTVLTVTVSLNVTATRPRVLEVCQRDALTKQIQVNCSRECRYRPGPQAADWSACDANNQTQRRLQLKQGSPSSCPAEKTVTKVCSKCRYDKGDWSECDEQTQMKTRTFTLRASPPSPASCPQTKTKTKSCGARGEGNRPRGQGGRRGGKGRGGRQNGKGEGRQGQKGRGGRRGQRRGRCSYGRWGDFEECANGVQRRSRELVNGTEDNCMRGTIQTKPCNQ